MDNEVFEVVEAVETAATSPRTPAGRTQQPGTVMSRLKERFAGPAVDGVISPVIAPSRCASSAADGATMKVSACLRRTRRGLLPSWLTWLNCRLLMIWPT